MQAFYHHIGDPGNRDLRHTVDRKRDFAELLRDMPKHAEQERQFFTHDEALQQAFPTGRFNCWGVPEGAESSFRRTQVGDLILLVHSAGHWGRGITHRRREGCLQLPVLGCVAHSVARFGPVPVAFVLRR